MLIHAVSVSLLIPLAIFAQPGAQCKVISSQIGDLRTQSKNLADSLSRPPFPAPAEKAAIAAQIKAIDAQITQQQAQLTKCLASASTSGGEAFPMHGGLTLTAAQVAAASAQIKCNPVAPPKPNYGFGILAQSPAPARSWFAPACFPGNPSDAQIAVSSSTVIVTFERTMVWYDKNGVKQGELTNFLLFQTLLATLAPVIGDSRGNPCPAAPGEKCAQTQSDFRVLFDEYRKRFWVLDGAGLYPADRNPKHAEGIFLVAVSKSEDPKDGWYLYWLDCVAHFGQVNDKIYSPGDVADYPSIGIDPVAFSVTNCVGTGPNCQPYKYDHLAYFDADEAVKGIAPRGWHYYDLQNPEGGPTSVIQPAVHHGATGRSYSVSLYGPDEVLVFAQTDVFCRPAPLSVWPSSWSMARARAFPSIRQLTRRSQAQFRRLP